MLIVNDLHSTGGLRSLVFLLNDFFDKRSFGRVMSFSFRFCEIWRVVIGVS